jgi:SAM-dependent methyltransferase
MQPVDYEALADDYARHRRAHPGVLDRLVDGLDRAEQVLEVGCGTGNYVCEVQRLVGCECTGIDPAPRMLEKLRTRGGQVQVCECPAERLSLASDTFDLAFSVDVVHHIGDRMSAFREVFRVLRAGGRICSVTDSGWIIRHREPLSRYFPETVTVDLARYPSIAAMRLEMESAGFDSIREELVELDYDLHEPDAYRNKVFSSLPFLEPEAFQRGLTRLEADLRRGPIRCNSRYLLLWGTKSDTKTGPKGAAPRRA